MTLTISTTGPVDIGKESETNKLMSKLDFLLLISSFCTKKPPMSIKSANDRKDTESKLIYESKAILN